jgi:hypothetical protein
VRIDSHYKQTIQLLELQRMIWMPKYHNTLTCKCKHVRNKRLLWLRKFPVIRGQTNRNFLCVWQKYHFLRNERLESQRKMVDKVKCDVFPTWQFTYFHFNTYTRIYQLKYRYAIAEAIQVQSRRMLHSSRQHTLFIYALRIYNGIDCNVYTLLYLRL